jgi:hypothetical protein
MRITFGRHATKLLAHALIASALATVVIATPAAGQKRSENTLRLTLTIAAFSVADNLPAGDSPGDLLVNRGRMMSRGRDVGRYYFWCITIRIGAVDCHGQLIFARGRVLAHFESVGTLVQNAGAGAVTGGTRRYLGAEGEVRTSFQGGVLRMTVRLR